MKEVRTATITAPITGAVAATIATTAIGDDRGPRRNTPPADVLREGYRRMVLIREFEEMALYQSTLGKVHGTLHLYIGQEASGAGICASLRDGDYAASNHRGHGHSLAMGADPKRMMAELFGRADGYCRGKGGSMHIADFARGILGANGIVAAGLGLAAGAALSAKLDGGDSVAVAFFGDGATARGPFHEVLNLAALWRLPCIFVCENNGYAQWVRHTDNLAVERVSALAASYGMPGVTVDGNDFMAVQRAGAEAVERARRGDGPSLIECLTYRIYGHSLGDMNVYRTKEAVDAWRRPERDPILRLEASLRDLGLLDDASIAAIHHDVDRDIDEAVAFAEASPHPEPGTLMTDVTELAAVRRPTPDWQLGE